MLKSTMPRAGMMFLIAGVCAFQDLEAQKLEVGTLREAWTLDSRVMSEVRTIHADIPDSCRDIPCPVMVVLDAEFLFPVVTGVQHLLSHRFVGRTAPVIAVGVVNTDRMRDTTPTATQRFPSGGGGRRFLEFLVEELLPEIESRYSTTGTNVLIGHSGSGLVALLALMYSPGAFDGVLALDPSVDWDDSVILADIETWVQGKGVRDSVVLAVDTYRLKPTLGALVGLLQQAPENVFWSTAVHEGETHQTMLIPALRRALPLVLAPSN